MEHHTARLDMLEAGSASLGSEVESPDADLFLGARVDARAEHSRQQLSAEPNAKHGRPLLEAALDQLQLLDQKRVAILLVGADRPAQDNQQIVAAEFHGREIVHAGVEIARSTAARGEQPVDDPKILEGHVANGD